MTVMPLRHIAWSTDSVDLDDPFQRNWYIRQVLINGRAQDIQKLNLDELELILDGLDLPPDIHSLWKCFLELRRATG